MPIESLQSRFAPRLAQRQAESLLRSRPLVNSPQTPSMNINGLEIINFSSNDYLGLANAVEIRQTLCENADLSYGSGAAHLVTGHHLQHHLLEDELADWLGTERTLLFSTGYMANLAVQQTLMQKGDVILGDKLNHASLIDGALHAEADFKRYPHNDMEVLEKRLQQAQSKGQQALIVTDSVFSMDGDLCPLSDIQTLAKNYQAWLFVDDAHGLGVLGKHGKGSFEHFGLTPDDNTLIMGTFGKAFGTFGAFVAGTHTAIDALIQFARPYIYTTAMPKWNALATRTALKLIQQSNTRIETLKQNIVYFKQQARAMGLKLMPSDSAIQPILLGDSALAIQWSEALKQHGFWVTAIRPPTVPANTARLRITLSTAHPLQQIDQLCQALAQCQAEIPPLKR